MKARWLDLNYLSDEIAPYISAAPVMLGDATIWARITRGAPTLALLSSVKAPAGILLAVHDLARHWRQHGPIIISGFQSPVENEALAMLLKGTWPVVMVLARGLYRRPPSSLRPALDDGRLLIISPFKESVRRASAATAAIRNRMLCTLVNEVLIAHAEPGSKTELLAKGVLTSGKLVYTIDHPANRQLIQLGVAVYRAR